ncbi:uncharacterized protein LOC106874622 [Octopus bimaculoides]|uniref:MalT-like TPR region domain-containing protein n=1 Tax=Octopus bimaculoides TaxID=37653 RepID=A0A0L8GUJ9_OCTBM|nr:uncharacterized protein LOC106874622 [Octopus bimaculoides]|eukprot:XP_014777900.1 PREDICTED: uncharacterized protein LOC106874622 [Octopus bimaculoides]
MYNTFTNCSSISNTKWKICIFDDFQNIQESFLPDFQELCDNDFPMHINLKIILILSGGKPFQFDAINFGECKVSPLSIKEGQFLFCRCSNIEKDDENEEQIHNIIRYACGLPGLLIYYAEKISQFHHHFSFDDIYKMICDETSINDLLDECTINRRNIKQEMDKYFSQLSHKQLEALKLLSYFPGRFGIEEAVEMTDSSSQPASKMHVLMPLVEQGLINSDLELQNFQVQELIRAITKQQIDNVHSNDLVKLKYTNIIGKSLMKAQNIYDKGLIHEALGIMSNNWENITFILKRGIDAPSDGRTYGVYYEIATKASQILWLCYPTESQDFLLACLQNSMLFGNEEEKALMNIAYGISLTNLPGLGGYTEAISYYEKAMNVLQSRNLQYRQMLLYNSMAYNYHMQGKYVESLNSAEIGYNMVVKDVSPQMVLHVKINSASIMAYNLSLIGYYDRCEKLLSENLGKISSHHPSLAVMLNTMGINYERNGLQYDEAFIFYNASLRERMKVAAINPRLSVVANCNVAKIISRDRGNHETALKFLLKSKAILKKQSWHHVITSELLNQTGQVYLRMHDMTNALAAFLESLYIYNKIDPNNSAKIEVLNMIAHCNLLQESFDNAREYFQDVLQVNTRASMSCVLEVEGYAIAMEHLVYLSFENCETQMAALETLLEELRQINILSVNLEQKMQYSSAIAKYQGLKIKLLKKFDYNSKRTGLLINSLPVICDFCQDYKRYVNCSQENYTFKLCGLRSIINDFDLQELSLQD